MILAIALFETPRLRKWRISFSLPSRRETISNPLGAPQLRARGSGLGEALTGGLGDEITLDLGEQREKRGHDLGLGVVLAASTSCTLNLSLTGLCSIGLPPGIAVPPVSIIR